jgi:hypothetical protein
MRKQFDSCSYDELTGCIIARIEWIRERQKFLKDPNSHPYGNIRVTVSLNILSYKHEIKKLLKMRRILKKSSYKSWNSDLLPIPDVSHVKNLY